MALHSLLERQLKKLSLSEGDCPKDNISWHNFLERVSKAYKEADQDRKLGERSQEISSRELRSLFERLEESQKIAHLGSWSLSSDKNKVYWSKETFKIFGRDLNLGLPNYEEIFSYIFLEDREKCENIVKLAFEEGKDFELDLRILVNNQPHWIHSIGKPRYDNVLGKFTILSGTVMSIDKQMKDAESLHNLSKQLITAARRAGMAEVATSVLHNIGNIMNSVNVSSNSLLNKLSETKLSGLREISNILKAHQHDFEKFVTENPQGKNLITYIEKISEFWDTRKIIFIRELNEINHNIKNIKEIIRAQQMFSGTMGVIEEINLCDLIEESIQMYRKNFFQGGINFVFECDIQINILTDKVKLLQILVNLIRNAYESVLESNVKNKYIKIIVTEQDKTHIYIKTLDNGIGIKEENLEKIFFHGFTTKKGGHGFGLHISALSARELGGSLTVESEGEGMGCIFTLLLPKKPKRRKEDIECS